MNRFENIAKIKTAHFTVAKTSPWTSYFAVHIAKRNTAAVRFDRPSLTFTLELQFLQCLGRQALQKLHVNAKIQ